MKGEIDVEGVIPERREEAASELQNMLHNFLDQAKGKINARIIVARDFAQTVESFRQNSLKGEFPYDPKRSETISCAKTMPYVQNGELKFAIVMDGKILGNWKEEQKYTRMVKLIHEFIHVIDNKALYDRLGAEAFFKEPNTVEEWMISLAHDVWMEYHAERFVYQTFEEFVRKSWQEASINYGPIYGYVDSFFNILSKLPSFLQTIIDDFIKCKLNMDEFFPSVYFRIREMLVLAAYTSALTEVLPDFVKRMQPIRQTKEYQFFLADLWTDIHEELKQLYLENGTKEDIQMRRIADYLRCLFSRCGCDMNNTSQGMFVRVNQINI